MTPWLTPTLTLCGVLVGALFAPLAATRFGWQTSRREAFDRAISAVRAAQLAASYPRAVNQSEIGNSEEALAYLRELPIKGFECYRLAVQEMRSSLAALEPYLTLEWDPDQWHTQEATYIGLLTQLKKARRRTLIFYWGSEKRVKS